MFSLGSLRPYYDMASVIVYSFQEVYISIAGIVVLFFNLNLRISLSFLATFLSCL